MCCIIVQRMTKASACLFSRDNPHTLTQLRKRLGVLYSSRQCKQAGQNTQHAEIGHEVNRSHTHLGSSCRRQTPRGSLSPPARCVREKLCAVRCAGAARGTMAAEVSTSGDRYIYGRVIPDFTPVARAHRTISIRSEAVLIPWRTGCALIHTKRQQSSL